jgi:hypothetical protein
VADGSFGLQWILASSTGGGAIRGTSGNNLINAIGGGDAVDGATGHDIRSTASRAKALCSQ